MADRLNIGFLPLVDACLPILAQEHGFAEEEGLTLNFIRDVSWATVLDWLLYGHSDATHLVAPLAIATTLGRGRMAQPLATPFVLGLNGNAITFANDLAAKLVTPGQLGDPVVAGARLREEAQKALARGPRLDIFGIKKEDFPAVWADLNAARMVSGHAYGKSLRTVTTCVGSEWCRFGTQDSTGLGVQIEQSTWGSWMPHKFKIAVSGCPRNCTEATIKDFGIICVDSGYELHVGGNGGIKVRVTDLLCKVATEAEAIEHCAAFIQLYREQAHYLERTAP